MTTALSRKTIMMTTTVVVMIAILAGPTILQSSFAIKPVSHPDPIEAKARAIQNGISIDTSTTGMVGSDIDCYGGVDSASGADSAVCYLVPDGVATPNYKTDPSVISMPMSAAACPSGAGFTSGEECFSTTFDQGLFTPGHWRFVVEFFAGPTQVDLAGIDYRVHSFFVLPESPIGVAALMGSSLAVLGTFMFFKRRNSSAQATTTGLGI
jgi:hypothetical protein